MPKAKLSVTLDRAKLARAQELTGAATVSELLDLAVTRLLTQELERRHVAGYQRQPQGNDDIAWAEVAREQADVADDTDWAGLYGVTPISIRSSLLP